VLDAIRIVPLRHEGAPPAPAVAPELTYRGGPLIANAEVVAVYWGSAWGAGPLAALVPRLDAFFDFVLTSELMDQLAEYSVEGTTIGHGTRIASSVLDSVPTVPALSDQQLRDGLQAAMPTLPSPNASRIYAIFLPPNVSVIMGGSRSCQAFCGYHDSIDSEIFYGVLPYPGCPGCIGPLDELDTLTSTTSHELAEAITDPVPGTGWYDDAHGEIGDICAWQTKRLGQYLVQLEWSNRARGCI
jgi:hypothetical protein